MKISEGSTEEVAKGGSRVTGAKGERALDYLTFFAQDWRMNIMFLLNHDIHMGIYLFIDIAHVLFSGRTVENEPCLFLIFSFIISTVCTSMHIIYMEQGPRATCFSRPFLCAPTFPPLLFHGTFRFVCFHHNKT